MTAARETVLITGASSGIGWELAREFARDGSELILVARREEKLRELAESLEQAHGTRSLVLPCDLTEPDAAARLFQQVREAGQEVDVLVNNAGFGQIGAFAEIPLERQLRMIQLNISALTELTHRFLQEMLARNRGTILNLGSTASFQPGPNCAVYYATKAFVLSFSEALSQELRKSRVRVCCLCPGPTRTGFGDDSGMSSSTVFQLNSMGVERVARAGYQAVRKGQRLVIPGCWNNLLAGSVRLTPRGVILQILDRFNSSRGGKARHG